MYREDYAGEIIAKTKCGHCPIKGPCLIEALLDKEEFGIWGGKTPRERRRLRPYLTATVNFSTREYLSHSPLTVSTNDS